ncbi:MAG: sulfotransferase [Paracoccaceae bacterium]
MQPHQKNAQPALDPWMVRIAEKINSGDYTSALAELLPLVQSPAMTAQILEFTVICYWELKDEQTAFALSDLAIQRFPECAAIWSQRGNLAINTGDNVLAQACFKSALQSSPKDLHSLIALNTLEIFQKGSNFDKKLRRALQSKKLSQRELVAIHTAIAQIEHKGGGTKRAFHHFKTANEANPGEYHPKAMEDLLAAQKSKFRPVRSTSASKSRPSLILIGGMPRSGTTLVEAVLSMHPDVRCIGESSALQKTLSKARRMAARRFAPKSDWDWYSQLSETQIAKLRKEFSEMIGLGKKDNRTIVDKMPLNCLDIGLAHLLIPDVRFIHLLRNPLDCGWSNYATHFKTGNGFSSRLDWIGHLIQISHDSAVDYATKLGSSFRFQSYKALVTDPETEVRNLLSHTSLDWNPACLTPEKAHRVQRTASMLQVRKPINKDALGKSQEFEQYLAPLVKAMGGEDWLDAWIAFDDHLATEGDTAFKQFKAVS